MIVYKVKNNQVVEVECDEMKYPLRDADGDTIFINTHFSTKEETYDKAIKECEAGVRIYTRDIIQTKSSLLIQQEKLTDECIALEKLREEYRDFKEVEG